MYSMHGIFCSYCIILPVPGILTSVIVMSGAEQYLSFLLAATQLTRHKLTLSLDKAASHSLKSTLKKQISEFDRIEYEIQSAASRRLWDLEEFDVGTLQLKSLCFIFRLKQCRSDTQIAELIIRLYTNTLISELNSSRSADADDPQTRIILQKLIDYHMVTLRQLLSYL